MVTAFFMPKNKEQKKEILKDIKEKIDKQKTMVFVGFSGLKTKDVFALRENLKKENCLLSVVKKTLLALAFKEKKLKINKKKLEGELALAYGFEDEISPARITYRFSLKNENLKILGGFFGNKFIEAQEVISLAKLPSKKELYSKVVGTINAPLSGFARVLGGNIRGLVYILSQIKK